MRIEDDDKKAGKKRRDVIRQIERYQEEQKSAECNRPAAPVSTAQAVRALEQLALAQADDASRTAQAVRGDVRRPDGGEQAVRAANRQEDAGRQWQSYSQVSEARAVPANVAEVAADEARSREHRQEDAQEDNERVCARDLQNERLLRQGIIRG